MSAAVANGGERLALREVLLRTTRLRLEQLEEAVRRQQRKAGGSPTRSSSSATCAKKKCCRCSGQQFGMLLHGEVLARGVDPELAARVPIAFAKTHGLAAARAHRERASASRSRIRSTPRALDDLRLLFDGAEIETELATRGARSSPRSTRSTTAAPARSTDIVDEAHEDFAALASEICAEPQDLLESQDDAPIIRLVDSLLQQAVKERASDIHIEPFEREIRVRFRFDNMLYEPVTPLPKALLPRSSRASRSSAASTSPRSACRRTAASA